MSRLLNPKVYTHQGRTLVNRDWMAAHSGASRRTVDLWYARWNQWPEDHRPPPRLLRIDRTDFYDDREAFIAWLSWWLKTKRASVRAADPELYRGDPEELIPLQTAAVLLHLEESSISSYQQRKPGYFAPAVTRVRGPRGRLVQAFRRGDLQDFDRRRTGKGPIGVVGPKPGSHRADSGSARRSGEVERRIALAAEYLRQIGGWRRGVAVELAELHGGSAVSWQRAVRAARERL